MASPLAEKPQRQTQAAAARTEERKLRNVRSPKELNAGGEAEGLRLAGHPGSTREHRGLALGEPATLPLHSELRPQAKLRSQRCGEGGAAGEGRGSPPLPAALQLSPPRTCCGV